MSEQLEQGSMLLWYRIESVLGRGGFGITYLATDTNLHIQVAIKEYLPGDIASRTQNSYIVPKSGTDGEMYRWGLTRFIEEARILAMFKHPNIVRVLSVFEENNTAYMIMEYERGNNLELMLRTPNYQTEQRLLEVFDAILQGLEQVHTYNIIHRDIKPANIYIRDDGTPVLLDFGSARQHIDGKSQNMTRILTKGYAPYEQIDESAGEQGPWTDIYAIGATLYYAINRQGLPTDSLNRFTKIIRDLPDPFIPASELVISEQYSPEFLFAVDQALKFHSSDRPQTAHEFRKLLNPGIADLKPANPINPVSAIDHGETVLVPGMSSKPVPLTEDRTSYGAQIGLHETGSGAAAEPGTSANKLLNTANNNENSANSRKFGSKSIISAMLGFVAIVIMGLYLTGQIPDQSSDSNIEIAKQSGRDNLNLNDAGDSGQQPQGSQQSDDQIEKERLALEVAERLEQSRIGQQKADQSEQERIAREDAERLKQIRIDREKAEQLKQQRIAQEESERLEQIRVEREKAEQLQQQRRVAEEEAKRLEQIRVDREKAEQLQQQLIAEEKAYQLEQERIAREEAERLEQARIQIEQTRLEELKRIEALELERLNKLLAEEKLAKEKARLALEAKKAEEKKVAAEKKKNEQKTTVNQTIPAKPKKKSSTPSKEVLAERKLQDKETDIQSVSRLFNSFKTNLGSCDTRELTKTTLANKNSTEFINTLCGSYKNMDLKISNFKSNVNRGTASANVVIRKLESNSGDTVIPSKSWSSLEIKTEKSKGYWNVIEWNRTQ